MQYNKSGIQKMAQTQMDPQEPDLASKVNEIMQEAMEAAQRSSGKLRKLQRGLISCKSSSEVGSIMGTCQGGLRQAFRLPRNLCGTSTAEKVNLVEVEDNPGGAGNKSG
jgi:hypothetical protein